MDKVMMVTAKVSRIQLQRYLISFAYNLLVHFIYFTQSIQELIFAFSFLEFVQLLRFHEQLTVDGADFVLRLVLKLVRFNFFLITRLIITFPIIVSLIALGDVFKLSRLTVICFTSLWHLCFGQGQAFYKNKDL